MYFPLQHSKSNRLQYVRKKLVQHSSVRMASVIAKPQESPALNTLNKHFGEERGQTLYSLGMAAERVRRFSR